VSGAPVTGPADQLVQIEYGTPQRNGAGVLRTLGWAVYLASSWTWCIGMFLPVLLVRDYGLWGWIVFAVPNVIGAAAMGWVLRTREASHAIVANHSRAVCWFSLVTVAFHIFFVMFILHRLIVYELNTYIWVALLAAAIFAIGRRQVGIDIVMAVIAFAISVGAIVVFIGTAGIELPEPRAMRPMPGVWPLAAACIFGFALCPYLDGTFHRARAATSSSGAKLAFGAGFGVFFLTMIIFTLLYARPIANAFNRSERLLPAAVVIAIAVHMVAQSAFTVAVHMRMAESLWQFLAGAFAMALALTFAGWSIAPWTLLAPDEVVYRLFMSFYALVFPAYVWLCVIPLRGNAKPSKRMLAVFATAVIVAAPMFAIAFLGNRMVWLLPGLIVVLLARLASTGSTPPRDRSPSLPPA
jgi:hypothetical protein